MQKLRNQTRWGSTTISISVRYFLMQDVARSVVNVNVRCRGALHRIWWDSQIRQHGSLIARLDAFPKEGLTMRTFADTDVQARLIREMRELYEKRGKLEAGIRAVDTARSLRIEKDALVDIAAYRALLSRPQAM
jgi:hypothetical protein